MTSPNAIEEFLTENSFRRYPLAEDCDVSYSGGNLPDSVVLDFQGWHRDRPDNTPQLAAIIGPDGAGLGPYVPNADSFSVYFIAGSGETAAVIWSFIVPILQPTFPVSMTSRVSDENYDGSFIGVARATFGQEILNTPLDADWIFSGATLEPGVVKEAYRSQVDSIRIVHFDGDDEFVGGDVEFIGGYNVDVFPSVGGIRISPFPGAGTLGRFTGSLNTPEPPECVGVLMSVNKVVPDEERQNLTIEGENGIEVQNFPDDHLIKIRVAPEHFGGSICA